MNHVEEDIDAPLSSEAMSISDGGSSRSNDSDGNENSDPSDDSGSECSGCGCNPCINASSSSEEISADEKLIIAINNQHFDQALDLLRAAYRSFSPSTRLKILSELVTAYIEVNSHRPKYKFVSLPNEKKFQQAIDDFLNEADDNDTLFIRTPTGWVKFGYNPAKPLSSSMDEEYDFYIHEPISDDKLHDQLETIRLSPNPQFHQYQLAKELGQSTLTKKQELDLLRNCIRFVITTETDFAQRGLQDVINGSSNGQEVPFNEICYTGCLELAKLFLKTGHVDITTLDDEGYDAIHCAILGGQYDILDLLISELDPENITRYTGSNKARQVLSDALDFDFDIAPPPDRRDYASNAYGKILYDADWEDFVDDCAMREIIADLADGDNPEYRQYDNEFEGRTYLHVAIECQDPRMVLRVLDAFYSHLSLKDDIEEKRCIELARINAIQELGEEQLKHLENILGRINSCFRNKKKHVTVHDLLKEVLEQLSDQDLSVFKQMLTWKVFDRYIITGIFQNLSKDDSPSSLQAFRQAVDSIRVERDHQNIDRPALKSLFSSRLLIYTLVRAAHELDANDNYSSGEELDELFEEAQQRQRDNELRQVKISSLDISKGNHSNNTPEQYLLEELDSSDGGLYVPIFRGINFKRDVFSSGEANTYENMSKEQKEFFSHSSYTLAEKKPFQTDVSLEVLQETTRQIKDLMSQISDKDTSKIFSTKEDLLKGCSSLRMLIQRIYTEDIDGFNYHLFEKIVGACEESQSIRELITQRFPLLSKVLEENPFASGSAIPDHGVRYALGLSRAFANIDLLLQPHYDSKGKPKHPCVGLVFVALYPLNEYLSSDAIYVPQAWIDGEIRSLKNHMQLLPEAEVTFPGSMSNILRSFSIFYPSFEEEHRSKVIEQFKFTHEQYHEIQKGVKSKRGSEEYRKALGLLREHLNIFYNKFICEWLETTAKNQNIHLRYQMPAEKGKRRFTDTCPTPDEVRKEAIHYQGEATSQTESKAYIKANSEGSSRFRKQRITGPLHRFFSAKKPSSKQKKPIQRAKRERSELFDGMRNQCINVSGFRNNCGLYSFALGASLAARFGKKGNIPECIRSISQADVDGSNQARLEEIGSFMRTQLRGALEKDENLLQQRKHSITACVIAILNNTPVPPDMESFSNSNKAVFNEVVRCELLNQIEQSFSEDLMPEVIDISQATFNYYKNELLDILKAPSPGSQREKFNNFIQFLRTNSAESLKTTVVLFTGAWALITDTDASERSRQSLKEMITHWLIESASSLLATEDHTARAYHRYGKIISHFAGISSLHWSKYLALCELMKTKWNTIWNNYLDYVEEQPVQLSADELGVLAKAWDIHLHIRTANSDYWVTLIQSDPDSRLQVRLYNSSNHWQVDNRNTTAPPIMPKLTDIFQTRPQKKQDTGTKGSGMEKKR